MSVKILHTADWHLGKKLYDYSLAEDHKLFFTDLLSIITKNKVDYLLISGDVFDLSHPSNESLELYYSFITQLIPTGCKLIVTGGNHDSPGVLNAPKNILDLLNVFVIGCATSSPEKLLIPLFNKENALSAVVAAVPYLRDRDIRVLSEGASTDQRIADIRSGIRNYYHQLGEICAGKFPGVPAIAMGHLFAQNAAISDSEREIQIGNLAGIDANSFPMVFRYVALGHIHKPQTVGDSNRIRYSGSPLPLSLSEKNYNHQVVLLDISGDQVSQEIIPLPRHRKLALLEGSQGEVTQFVSEFVNEYSLPALLEVRITEKNYDPLILRSQNILSEEIHKQNALIVQFRVYFENAGVTENNLSSEEENISDLHPSVLWDSLISTYLPEQQQELREAFLEIFDSAYLNEES